MPTPAEHSEQAEQAVLGGLIQNNRTLYALGPLEPADFGDELHARLFSVIRQRIHAGSDVDVLTLQSWLEGDGELVYLAQCARAPFALQNVGEYARIIRDRSKRREARRVLSEGLKRLDDDPNADVVGDVMSGLEGAATRTVPDASFAEVIDAAEAWKREVRDRKTDAIGVSTTLPTLDGYLGGLNGSRVYVLGGRPGRFKSVFAWQICLQAGRHGKPVGMCSLEMPRYELGIRAFAAEMVDRGWPIRVDDRSRGLAEISARICEWRYRFAIELAVVDHIQLVRTNQRKRFEELAEVSRRMKDLAMDLGIPILVLSQLSREVERENRPPRLSDLRECGNLEQDADCVLFIHCEESKGRAGPDGDNYSLLVAKNRGGVARTKPIALHVDGAKMRVGEALL